MGVAYISHTRAITPIQDPIHGTLKFTIFEREIIDSPYFQRLHFVLQNSTTYTAYPSNKNTRFTHSLGVAHIAGRLLSQSLANSSFPDLSAFLTDVSQFIES